MGVHGFISYWVFQPESWEILSIILIILDISVGLGLFVLPIGVASIILSGVIYAQTERLFGDFIIFETWKGLLIMFAVLSIVSIFLIKKIFQNTNKNRSDINQYLLGHCDNDC